MRMLKTPPFFSPKSGEKPSLEVFSRFGLWRDFLNNNVQATISAFRLIKNMSINPKLVEFHQFHAKSHLICFFFITISKITKEIFAKIYWMKTPTRTWKCTHYIMQMSYLYTSDFPLKTFAKSFNIQKQYEKNVWEKSNDAYSLSTRVQTTINHISIQSASWKRYCATHWRERRGWDPVMFDDFWLVRSEHTHASYPGLFFRPPGFSPYMGREERRVQGRD